MKISSGISYWFPWPPLIFVGGGMPQLLSISATSVTMSIELIDVLINWLNSELMMYWLIDWFAVCLSWWLYGWLAGWLVDWLIDWLISWFVSEWFSLCILIFKKIRINLENDGLCNNNLESRPGAAEQGGWGHRPPHKKIWGGARHPTLPNKMLAT